MAALDLPDPQVWQDFCQNNGLPVPPPLQLDRAAQLNDAYALDQPLEHLLSQHRLLALARGPVRQRLALLRQIAGVDAANPSWERDIRVFEKARLKELPTAFYNAVKSRDGSVINSLMKEVNETQWLEPVPTDLSTAVSDAFNRMQRAKVEAELRTLVEPLREAYAARSFHECQAMVAQWKNIMDQGGVTMISTELTDEIRPVIAFVQEQEKKEELQRKFRDSCKAFGNMLDMNANDAQLEAGYAKLKNFNEPIPEELTARYNDKRAGRQRDIERKHRGKLIAMGVTIGGLVAVSIVVAVLMTRSSDAKKWADKIEQQTSTRSENNLRSAQQLVDELKKNHPSFTSEPLVAASVRHVNQMQGEFDHDTGTLQSLLNGLNGSVKAATPVANKTDATVDDLLAAAAPVQDAVTQANNAGDLSWVDPDKKLAPALVQAHGVQARLEERASAGVQAEVTQIASAVDAMPAMPADLGQADTALVTAGNRARTLRELNGINEEAKNAASALVDKVDARRKSLDATREMAGELASIRTNSTTADNLQKSLAAFVQKYPNDARTADFNVVINRLNAAKDAEAWHDTATSWAGQFSPTTAEAAHERGEEVTGYLSAHPASPMTAIANSYADYLKRAADAMADKGSWQEALTGYFADPRLSSIAYMETSDGQRFYTEGDINREEAHMNGQTTVRFVAVDPSNQTQRMKVTVEPPTKLVTETPVPLPHTKVIQALVEQLKGIDAANWETWGIDAVDTLLKYHDMNLVIKATVIEKLLQTEIAVAGWNGSGLSDAYGHTLTELARQKPADLPWADLNKNSETTLKNLQKTLSSLPSASVVKEHLAAARANLFHEVAFDIVGTGVLLKDDAGRWSVASTGKDSDGQLWTAVPRAGTSAAPIDPAADTQATASSTPGTMVQLGTVKDGKYALYESAVRDLPQGTMVFIIGNDAGK